MSSSSDDETNSGPELRARPKTRQAVLSFVEEDIEEILASKDPAKAIKKWYPKLKADYGSHSHKRERSDSEKELKVPKEEDLSEKERDETPPPVGVTTRRLKGRRAKARSISTLIRMRRTRFRSKLPTETIPEPFPITQMELEHDEMIYKVGDIVKTQGPGASYAQIRGFYRDQFCEKYASLQWLIPNKTNMEDNDRIHGIFDPSTFTQGQILTDPVNLRQLNFVTRPPSSITQPKRHDQRIMRTNGQWEYMNDGTNFAIGSLHRPWFQFIY